MSGSPDYASQSRNLARPPLSKAAITSLILGVVLCIPFITSLFAILFAVAGFRATRGTAARGRGFAAAGLTLGILGMLCWSGVGGLVLVVIVGSQAPRAVVHDFARNVTSGNIPAASAECDPSIKPPDLETLHTQIAAFGTYTDLTCFSANMQSRPSGTTCILTGTATFSSGTHPFNAVLVKDPSGHWKMMGFHVD